MPPLDWTTPIAKDGFDGADTADIDGRTPDGGGVPGTNVGEWLRHPESDAGDTIGIAGNEAVKLDTGYAVAVLTDIPSLPTDYCAEAVVRYPAVGESAESFTPPCADHNINGSGVNPDFTLWGGWQESVTYWYRRTGTGPATASLEYETGNGSSFKWDLEWDGAGKLRLYKTRFAVGVPPFPDESETHELVSVRNEFPHDNCIYISLANSNGSAPHFETGVPQDITGHSVVVHSAQDHGGGSIVFFSGGHGLRTSFTSSVSGDVEEYPFFPETIVFTGGNEYAYQDVWVRSNPVTLDGFIFGLEFDHAATVPAFQFWLYHAAAGVYTLIDALFVDPGVHDLPKRISCAPTTVDGATVLDCYADDDPIPIFHFEVATGLAFETGMPVTDHLTGIPGLAGNDASGTGAFMKTEEFTVYTKTCEGPPGNEYPGNPPDPVDPTELNKEWRMQRGDWRVPITPPGRMRRGQFRAPPEATPGGPVAKWKMHKGVWREVILFDGEELPDPETPVPPHHDPCYIYPPIDPGEIDPLTSRFFGMGNIPLGGLGPLFTGTQKALGPWYIPDLAYTASIGATLVGAQGNARLLKAPGNRWDTAIFIAATLARIMPVYPTISTAPNFLGYSAADDIASKDLWYPSGLPQAEFRDAIGVVRLSAPNIRYGSRSFPTQWSLNPNLQFFTCQYTSGMGSPFDWAAENYAQALAWNAGVIMAVNYLGGGRKPPDPLSSGIRHFDNTIKGQSENNYVLSPAEIVQYWEGIFDGILSVDGTGAKFYGCLGYQFLPDYINSQGMFSALPGVMAALVTVRNMLAAFPALP